jgi:hypothetical protein
MAKKPLATAKKPDRAAAAEGASAPPSTPSSTAMERSALAALQAELDDERLAHRAAQVASERQVRALEAELAELREELARATARARELEAQLRQARGR